MSAYFAISRTAASRVHATGRVIWWGKATRHESRVHSAAGKISGGRKRAWGNRGLSAAVPKTMGFRPDGNKSSGMAARNP